MQVRKQQFEQDVEQQTGSKLGKEYVSFDCMAAVTICSDFGAQENKVCHCFVCFPTYLP